MPSSFDQLKKNREEQTKKLTEAADKMTSNRPGPDERFWKPTVDSNKNGSAIIRFLPAPPGEDVPFVRYWNHGFEGPGGWYIEKSLTSIGQPDPLGEYNQKLWATGIEANKSQVRKQKRRLHYIANIQVIKDPGNPDAEGKVFLYDFGKKIFDKINDAMHPEFEDEEAFNPFDFWEGANFRLRIREVDGFRNYDKSEFDTPSPLSEDDDELEKLWKSEYQLKEFIDPANYKSYTELQQRLIRVLQLDSSDSDLASGTQEHEEQQPEYKPSSEPKESKSEDTSTDVPWDNDSEEDGPGLDYFQNLADDK